MITLTVLEDRADRADFRRLERHWPTATGCPVCRTPHRCRIWANAYGNLCARGLLQPRRLS